MLLVWLAYTAAVVESRRAGVILDQNKVVESRRTGVILDQNKDTGSSGLREGVQAETDQNQAGQNQTGQNWRVSEPLPASLDDLLGALTPCGGASDAAGLFAKAMVIAPKKLAEEKRDLLKSLGFCMEQIDPVVTDENCVGGNAGMTGVSMAHKNAWEKIAQEMGVGAKKTLVLEADFSIGNQDVPKLKRKLEQLFANGDDYTGVGGCGAPLHLCTTGYFLSSGSAGMLQGMTNPLCGGPGAAPLDNFIDTLCEQGNLRCSFDMTSTMPGLSGNGLFQQDRIKYRGLHDEHNKLDTSGALDTVLSALEVANACSTSGECRSLLQFGAED